MAPHYSNSRPYSGGGPTGKRSSSPVSGIPPFKRVWVRRPGLEATTVQVGPMDIVDDLKSLVLMKYPNSLAAFCDPADLSIRFSIHPPRTASSEVGRARSRTTTESSLSDDSLAKSSPQKSSHTTPIEIILQPDELVYTVLDRYFPGGMTVKDAMIVEQTRISTERYIDVANNHNISSSIINNSASGALNIRSDKSALGREVSSPSMLPTPGFGLSFPSKNSNVGAKTPMTAVHSPIIGTTTAGPYRAHSETTHPLYPPSSAPSSVAPSKAKSNGVLLLPRQFQLPDSGARNISRRYTDSDEALHKQKAKSTESMEEKDSNNNSATPSVERMNSWNSVATSNPATAKYSSTDVATKKSEDDNNSDKNDNNNNKSTSTKPGRPIRKMVLSGSVPKIEGVVPQINVLIVEDNVINQKILETFLRKKKIRSAVAKDGKEAVEKWRQGGFHLILMDIQLPVMSGLEATKVIRRLEHENGIGAFSTADRNTRVVAKPEDVLDRKLFRSPVIIVALTASSSSADKSESLAAGCNDFLTKPVNLIWLEQKTIEWGCMQALIDYEGWKHWVGREDRNSKNNRRSLSRSRSSQTRKLKTTTSSASGGSALKRLQPLTVNTSRSPKAGPQSPSLNPPSSGEASGSEKPSLAPSRPASLLKEVSS